jgi:hypothetical protein
MFFFILSITMLCHSGQYNYAECHRQAQYAECYSQAQYAECHSDACRGYHDKFHNDTHNNELDCDIATLSIIKTQQSDISA